MVWPSEKEEALLSFGFSAPFRFFPSPLAFSPPLAFLPANPVKVIMIESGNIAQGEAREGRKGGRKEGRKDGEFAVHPPKIPVYLLDTDTKM